MNTWQYLSLWSLAPYPYTLLINCFIFIPVWQLFRAALCLLGLWPAQSGVEASDCQQLSSIKSSTHTFGLVTDASVINLKKTAFSNSPTRSKFCCVSQETEASHSLSKSFGGSSFTAAQNAKLLTFVCLAIKTVWPKSTMFSV